MKNKVPENAFKTLGLTPQASNPEILKAVTQKFRENPTQMAKLAEAQKILLNPGSRFLIEFLYFFDPEKLNFK